MQKIKAYQFDVDGNLFHLDTLAHVEVLKDWKLVQESINSEQWTKYSNAGIEIKYDESVGLTDFRRDEAWKRDFQDVLESGSDRYGYVEWTFRDAIRRVSEISFNTSRGHSIQAMTESVKQYIMTFDTFDQERMVKKLRRELTLSELTSFEEAVNIYLKERFKVYAVRWSEFAQLLGYDTMSMTIEQLKPLAYQHYVDSLVEKYKHHSKIISVGFSEDTAKYINAVRERIEQVILLDPKYDHVNPVLYHTISPRDRLSSYFRTEGEIVKTLSAKRR